MRSTYAPHPLISHVTVPPLEPIRARRIDPTVDREVLIRNLAKVAGVNTGDGAEPARRGFGSKD
jgi:hypothetical protein